MSRKYYLIARSDLKVFDNKAQLITNYSLGELITFDNERDKIKFLEEHQFVKSGAEIPSDCFNVYSPYFGHGWTNESK